MQGLINYYSLAHDVGRKMYRLRSYWKLSLLKTLAAKYRTRTAKLYQKYTMYTADGRKVIGVRIPRHGKKPLIAAFGRSPIRRNRQAVLKDRITTVYVKTRQLIVRLLADTCELCESTQDIEVHHIKKLKDLKRRYQGRKEPPPWVKRMIAIRRKTLVVCHQCHQMIHNGTYDGAKVTNTLLESRVR